MKEKYRFIVTNRTNGNTFVISEELFKELISDKDEDYLCVKDTQDGCVQTDFDIIRVKVK